MSVRGLANGAIHVYQRYVSRDYNAQNDARCMYTPSCSAYTRDAIQQDGLIDGLAKGALRLARCTDSLAQPLMRQFGEQLLDTSTDQLDTAFKYHDPAARTHLREVHDLFGEAAKAAEQGDTARSQRLDDKAGSIIRSQLHIRIEDVPSRRPDGRPTFLVGTPHVHPQPPAPQRGPLRTALASTAAVITGTAGAIAGLAFFAGGAALMSGTVFAPAAALGKTDALNDRIAARYGTESVHALIPFERRAGQAAFTIRDRVEQWTSSSALGAACGLIVGAPIGAAAAFAHGFARGLRSGWRAGSVLGRNLVLA